MKRKQVRTQYDVTQMNRAIALIDQGAKKAGMGRARYMTKIGVTPATYYNWIAQHKAGHRTRIRQATWAKILWNPGPQQRIPPIAADMIPNMGLQKATTRQRIEGIYSFLAREKLTAWQLEDKAGVSTGTIHSWKWKLKKGQALKLDRSPNYAKVSRIINAVTLHEAAHKAIQDSRNKSNGTYHAVQPIPRVPDYEATARMVLKKLLMAMAQAI